MGIVVRRQKPLQLENVQVSGRYAQVDIARREGLVSLLSAPLVFGGQTIGTLTVYTGMPHSFSNEEVHILSALAELSAIALEKAGFATNPMMPNPMRRARLAASFNCGTAGT